jgi:uncharacterized protein YdaU (DUF1376 family)
MTDRRWTQWMPFYIDRWKGSPHVQAMTPAARAGYLYLLAAAWQTSDCSVPHDDEELAVLAGYSDQEWEENRGKILRRFAVRPDGRLTNVVLLEEWQRAKSMTQARARGAEKTNDLRSANAQRKGSVHTPNADRAVITVTSTETEEQKTLSMALPSHSAHAEKGLAQKHPDLQIYEAYPRSVGRGAALKAIAGAVRRVSGGAEGEEPCEVREARQRLLTATARYAESPAGRNPDRSKIPHPATWFNQSRYLDDQADWQATGESSPRGKTGGLAVRPGVRKETALEAVTREQDEARRVLAAEQLADAYSEPRGAVFEEAHG